LLLSLQEITLVLGEGQDYTLQIIMVAYVTDVPFKQFTSRVDISATFGFSSA